VQRHLLESKPEFKEMVMASKQRIIDLDVAMPQSVAVKVRGKLYDLPGDIPVPDFLEIQQLTEELETAVEGGNDDGSDETIAELYERVMDLFRIENPALENLPLGPRRLGALVVQLYAGAAEEDGATEDPPRSKAAGTRSTSRKQPTKRSRGSK
jgi:hypothetical protein